MSWLNRYKTYSLKILIALSLILIQVSCLGQDTLKISSCGNQLKDFYLQQDVTEKWLSGHHVNWQTGEPDEPNATFEIKTHCSAFVASVCEKQGIYILRPPKHQQKLLANAQFDWFNSNESLICGWQRIESAPYVNAQKLANDGYIVIAVTRNADRHKPGHIALIMPSQQTQEELNTNGPMMIQASTKNSTNISFRKGFKHHIYDWNDAPNTIYFFFNKTKVFNN